MYLIVGGDSTIGRALSTYWCAEGVDHCASTRRRESVTENRPYLDLASMSWSDFKEDRYDAVVFCAAVTKLAECENHPRATSKINVEATIGLACFLGIRGSHLLMLSTNQVFDGRKPRPRVSDEVCPVTEYGRQKSEAERLILQMPRSAVLRLTKVVHPDLPLLKRWNNSLQSGQPIEAFDDMNIAPITLEDVVTQIDKLIRMSSTGIYHLSGDHDISYYSFARNYFKSIPNVEFLIRRSHSNNSQLTVSPVNLYTTLG